MNTDEIVIPILRAINDLREEVRDNKREIREMREENNRRWDENDKRWEENNRRWDENDKRWEENNRRWEKSDNDRKSDHDEVMDLFIKYDIAVSRKLGDPNADKMKRFLKVQ